MIKLLIFIACLLGFAYCQDSCPKMSEKQFLLMSLQKDIDNIIMGILLSATLIVIPFIVIAINFAIEKCKDFYR